MNDHPMQPARLAALVLTLGGSLVFVWSLRVAPLPGVGASTADWFREIGPAEGVLAVLRLVVLIGLLYLLTVTILITVSMLLRSNAVDRWAERVTGPAVQRFLRASVGLGIGTATTLHAIGAGAAPPPEDESPEPVPAASAEPTADETTTLTRVDDPAATDSTPEGPAEVSGPPAPAPAVGDPTAAEPSEPADWWTVAPGDHLWQIAEETLVDQGARAPSLDEIASYWHTLCEANHDRLVDPGNPDLIMPGQRIALPPVPVA